MRKQKTRLPFPSPPLLLLCSCLIYTLLTLPGEPVPTVPDGAQAPTLTIALAGDVMLGRGVAQGLDGDWEAAFAGVQPWLARADLAVANLESPLASSPLWAGTEGGQYDLRAPPEAAAALRAAGFDAVSLANNHALDAGEAGLQETVEALQAAGITPLRNWETGRLVDRSPPHHTGLPVYRSTNLPTYRLLAFDDSAAPLDLEAAAEAVAAAADQADAVVVSVHWGGEYQAGPGARQQAVARVLAQAGADVIAGHGPHVLQRVEWLGETLVAYSLGNLLFDQPYPADCRQGAILRATLRGGRVVAVEAVPTVTERGRVRLAGPEEAAAICGRLTLEPGARVCKRSDGRP